MIERKQELPVLLYDGECGYCRRWAERGRRWLAGRVDFRPGQDMAADYPELSAEELALSIHLVGADGAIEKGAAAAFRALAYRPGLGGPWWLYRRLAGLAPVSEFIYRFGARHRTLFSRIDAALYGRLSGPVQYGFVRNLFLLGLAIIYLIAFASFRVQADGLIGSRGILPIGQTMEIVDANLERDGVGPAGKFLRFPTVFWVASSDAAVQAVCVTGMVAALVAGLGLLGPLPFFLMWVLYLSICTAGQIFLGYQWDILLLETGFLAIFFAPWRVRPGLRFAREPSRIILFLYRWLMFRLMLGSGLVKIGSGDETWWPLMSAMSVHYETQPIPTWTAWYMHNLPAGMHKLSTASTLMLELLVPFLLFAPRRLRLLAACSFIGLQIIILSAGNYTFFNWLTIVLCIPLLDDSLLPAKLRNRIVRIDMKDGPRWLGASLAVVRLTLLCLLLTVSCGLFFGQANRFLTRFQLGGEYRMVRPISELYRAISPFRSISTYGLFAVMTTDRPEITIQGSVDGREWKEYVFKYKPGPRDRAPPFVAPHQPRLDWQLWFAALRSYQNNSTRGWMEPFLTRLLQGSEPVLALLSENPFPHHPPKYVRAIISDYRFTDPATRKETGNWWSSSGDRLYAPPLRLPEEIEPSE